MSFDKRRHPCNHGIHHASLLGGISVKSQSSYEYFCHPRKLHAPSSQPPPHPPSEATTSLSPRTIGLTLNPEFVFYIFLRPGASALSSLELVPAYVTLNSELIPNLFAL